MKSLHVHIFHMQTRMKYLIKFDENFRNLSLTLCCVGTVFKSYTDLVQILSLYL